MSAADHEIVERVALLARLELQPNEAKELGAQFQKILTQFQALTELDVSGVEPMLGGSAACNVLRDDVAEPSLAVEAVLANAPERVGEFYRVPKTVGGDE